MTKQLIKLIDQEINDFIVKDTYTRGKIAGLRTAKVIIIDFEQKPCEVCNVKYNLTYTDGKGFEEKANYCPNCGRKL